MNTKIMYSVKHLKSRTKMRIFFARFWGRICNSLRTENMTSTIVCVGTGKAGKINELLISQIHKKAVEMGKKAGSGVLTQIGGSAYQMVIINGSWTMNAFLIGSGNWNKPILYGKGEPSFTGRKIATTQKH